MISLVLAEKIFSLFLVMLMGFLIVKSGLLRPEDSRVVSVLSAYLILPCVILVSFQVDCSEEVLHGLGLSLAAALMLAAGQLAISALLGRLGFSREERCSVVYPNTGNLVIPLIISILGSGYVIYTSPFVSTQIFLLWSHGKAVLCGEKRPNIAKMLSNINMLAILAGVLMFAFRLRLPLPVLDAMESVSSMVGPCAMLVTGMLMGGMDFSKLRSYRRLPLILVCRLLLMPLVFIFIYKFSGIAALSGLSEGIMLIAILSVSTPTASTVTQLSQLFGADAAYANVINLATTVLCIATIPLMVALYQAL